MNKRGRRDLWDSICHACHGEKFPDRAKNVIIAALVLSASLLLIRSGMFDLRVSGSSDGGKTSQSTQQTAAASADVVAAGPYAIAVTDASGSHCGLMYDGTELRQAYDRLSAYLGEAFGSAGEAQQVSVEDWYAALEEPGVFFDFAYPQPLSLLASVLGTEMTSSSSDHSAGRFCIAVENDEVALYYLRQKDGGYYRCKTGISSAALSAKLRDWTANGARFLFETDYDFSLVDGSFLVEQGQAALHGVSAQNPIGSGFEPSVLASIFGMNSYMASSYTEADGTRVYVDGSAILRVHTDGSVSFKNSSAQGGEENRDNFAAALSAAARAVSASIGTAGGTASAALTYVGYDDKAAAYTVRYDYELGGLPVSLGDRHAAEFTVSGGVITQAELVFRQYSYSGEDDYPLPAVQAMAVVQASGGGTPLMCYVDDGESVRAGWTIVK